MLETDTAQTNGSPRPSDAMPDVQSRPDRRGVAIDRVGVRGVRYPLSFCGRDGGVQGVATTIDMHVALPADRKGTHMSRFLEVLAEIDEPLTPAGVVALTSRTRERLGAPRATVEMRFPYFLHKRAPVTESASPVDIEATIICTADDDGTDLVVELGVPATSLCPCSRDVSEYGAHNQRCLIRAAVRTSEPMWIEDLAAIMEQAASTQVYSLLKRPDEKHVTEAAYDNPKFVEDIVRDLAVALNDVDAVTWYRISSTNYESIHNHDAYAEIERTK